jgi:hypothetical protein
MPCYEYALVWFILVIICMSSLDVIVNLDVEIWLRLCKRYHWCRLTPEVMVMDLGRRVVED